MKCFWLSNLLKYYQGLFELWRRVSTFCSPLSSHGTCGFFTSVLFCCLCPPFCGLFIAHVWMLGVIKQTSQLLYFLFPAWIPWILVNWYWFIYLLLSSPDRRRNSWTNWPGITEETVLLFMVGLVQEGWWWFKVIKKEVTWVRGFNSSRSRTKEQY